MRAMRSIAVGQSFKNVPNDYKKCPQVPAQKEHPSANQGNADVLATTDTMTQSEGTKKIGAPARDRGSGLRQ